MEKFETHSGKAALLKRENIDTDQIIPKEYLKSIKRTGFDKGLFAYWRFDDQGNLKDDFALNQPKNLGATILLVGNNFGCGSSREHAVWALQQFGFKVIIAPTKEQNGQVIPGFADIFRSNSGKNGLLLIELAADSYEQLVQAFQKSTGTLNIDLPKQELSCEDLILSFEIEAGLKNKLLQGLDDIGLTLALENQIAAFEKKHRVWV